MAVLPKDLPTVVDPVQAIKDRGFGFLDLAGIHLPLPRAIREVIDSVKITPFLYKNDLALARPFRPKIVSSGQVKVVDLALLKALGHTGDFVLFPALPAELRIKIFRLAPQSRMIHVIEDVLPDGTHKMVIAGAKRPAVMEASKEAFEAIKETKVYQPLFQIGENGLKHFFDPELDRVKLLTVAGTFGHVPTLTLVAELRNPLDLHSIRILNIDLQMFEFCHAWMAENITTMPRLEGLHLTASLFDPLSTQVSQLQLNFEDPFGDFDNLCAYVFKPNGVVVKGMPAFAYATRAIQTPATKQHVKNLWIALQTTYGDVNNFPANVSLFFLYSPLPAPLAAPLLAAHPLAVAQVGN